MLLQNLPENQLTVKDISKGYGIWLFILYTILNFIGQGLSFFPQMLTVVEKQVGAAENLTQDSLMAALMKNLYYPWTINLIQLAVFIFILWLFKRKNVTFFSRNLPQKKEIGQIILMGLALVLSSLIVENSVLYFNSDFNTGNQEALEGFFSNSSLITMFISIVILAPITEEVMFRGVFGLIFKEQKVVGWLVCALVFTLFHMPTDLPSFIIYLTMALGLGAIYLKTGRIEGSIFAHFLNNLLGFIFMLN